MPAKGKVNPIIQIHLDAYYRNPFRSLEIGSTEDWKAINKQYKNLARQYHPSVNKGFKPNTNEEKFKEIGSAKGILEDPLLRTECFNYWKPQPGAGNTYHTRKQYRI